MQESEFKLAVAPEAYDAYALIHDVGDMLSESEAVQAAYDAIACLDEHGRLEIRFIKENKQMGGKLGKLQFDLTSIDIASGHGRSLKQPIAKAVGIKKGDPWRPKVLDCTAGLGEDGFLLAALGCHVTMIEQHPLVYAMLRDAISYAKERNDLLADIVSRMNLRHGNAIETMREIDNIDVVYLDPMYPEKKKRNSARTKKAIWFLRQLLGHDEADSSNTVGLLQGAQQIAKKRIVVKRPNHAPPLTNESLIKPEVSHEGKSFRFDVYPIIHP